MKRRSRREALKISAGAVISAPLLAQGGKLTLFFTAKEFRMVDELTELIIPADAHSPGAREAQVADYIDRRLAESFLPEPKLKWRDGLKRVDALCREMHSHGFLEATPQERVAVLERISKNEQHPSTPEEVFFGELKRSAAKGYYTSKTGIHTDMEYKGNTYLDKFSGYDTE